MRPAKRLSKIAHILLARFERRINYHQLWRNVVRLPFDLKACTSNVSTKQGRSRCSTVNKTCKRRRISHIYTRPYWNRERGRNLDMPGSIFHWRVLDSGAMYTWRQAVWLSWMIWQHYHYNRYYECRSDYHQYHNCYQLARNQQY